MGSFEALEFVLGGFLLRGSGFDHLGDAAGGKREGENYWQVFHGSVLVLGEGKVNVLGDDRLASLHLTAKHRLAR